jgi:TolB protein
MRALTILSILAAAVFAVSAAQAVTPGKNGLIYFENFSEDSQSSDIYSVSATGTGLTNLTKALTSNEAEPALSPNHQEIAYLSDRNGGEAYHLYVMKADGSASRSYNTGGVQQSSPAWSPNGRVIAFSRCTALDADTGDCTDAQIAIINNSNSGLKLLSKAVEGAIDSRPAWAPNGKSLVFQRMNADGVVSLWTVTSTGTKLKRIVNDGSTSDMSPTYAPNGKLIAFISDAGGSQSLYTVKPTGITKKKILSETPDPDDPTIGSGLENPAYSPNGKQFVFTSGGDIWSANINGSGRTQVTKDGGDEADWARG